MEEKKRGKKDRHAYLNDFVRTQSGGYIYTGRVYRWGGTRKGTLLRLWGLTAGMAVCAVAAGCIPGTGMERAVWAVVPYAVTLIAVFTCLYAVGRLSFAGSEVREYVFRGSVEALPRRCVVTAAAAIASILGEFVTLAILGMASSVGNAILLLLLEGLVLAGAVLARRTIVHTQWKSE